MLKTTEQQVVEKLRKRILDGSLPIGEFLSQRKLASLLECSLITVRAAMRQLENEGLMENVPRWGGRIPVETADTVRDRYFMRELLEIAAVRRFVTEKRYNENHFRELARNCDEMSGNTDEAIHEFARRHFDFHGYIAECSNSPLLVEFLKKLSSRSLMIMNAYRGWARGTDRSSNYHQDLAVILINGTVEVAERAMLEHMQSGLEHELEALSEQNVSEIYSNI